MFVVLCRIEIMSVTGQDVNVRYHQQCGDVANIGTSYRNRCEMQYGMPMFPVRKNEWIRVLTTSPSPERFSDGLRSTRGPCYKARRIIGPVKEEGISLLEILGELTTHEELFRVTEQWADGSRWNGFPNFAASSDVVGWIWNVDDGITTDDSKTWMDKITACHAAGKRVGLYKWLDRNHNPEDDAHDLLSKRDQAQAAGIPIAWLSPDHEDGDGDQVQRAIAAMRVIIAGHGSASTLYYSGGWWTNSHIAPYLNNHPVAAEEMAQWLLWDAAYTPAEPAPPQPFTKIGAWQYTSSGQLAGVSGRVDLDRVFVHIGDQANTYPLIVARDIMGTPGTVWMQADPRLWTAGIAPMFYTTRAKEESPLGKAEFAGEIAQILNLPIADLLKVAWWKDANGTQHKLADNPYPPAHTPVYYGSSRLGAAH